MTPTRRRLVAAGGATAAVGLVFMLAIADDGSEKNIIDSPAPQPRARSSVNSGISEQASAFEAEVVRLVNELRQTGTDCGGKHMSAVKPLRVDQRLAAAARLHSLDMATRRFFGHTNPDGITPVGRSLGQGYRSPFVGENCQMGAMTPVEALENWRESEGHCRNLMSPAYTNTGVGWAVGTAGSRDIYWTQMFGRRSVFGE